MNKISLVLKGCLMGMVLMMLIGCFWGIPITLASESGETPAAVASESGETPAAVASESGEAPAAVASESKEAPAAVASESKEAPAAVASESKEAPAAVASESKEAPAAVASESEETPAAVASESKETPAAVASESGEAPAAVASESEETPAAVASESKEAPAAVASESEETPAAVASESEEAPVAVASESKEAPAAVASESKEAPAAVASESEETPAAVASEYNKYNQYDPDTNYCGDMGYLPADPNLTEAENRGRCTWYLYTAGNEKFYRKLNLTTGGRFVDLLQFLDSRKHDERFANYGVMNDPGCKKATGPDQYGLWLDECKDPKSTGVVGFRKFKNPNFVAAKWDAQKYSKDPTIEPPYRIGASCTVCHITFNPLNPPKDLENPKWENLEPTLGNQYLEEGKLFAANLKADDFAKQVISAQPPGTSDTSRIGYDHINNPNTINSIFNLGDRPTHEEVMNDGHKEAVNHILKDGADSVGALTALKRVYVNIGSCSDYWLTLHEPFMGRTPQRPFDINKAREVCEDWRKTEELMPEMGLFLLSRKPLHLKDAPGGEAFLTKDESVLERGKVIFAQTCAQCHSSKKPPTEIAVDPAKAQQWYIESVKSPDFLENNFLSDDERYPVTLIGTNAARALATNAMKGHIWEQFSSKTYKEQPSPGKLTLYNPFNPNQPIEFQVPSGGPGYYRTPTLISIWATAPFFHNNALGIYNKDPSVEGRVNAYMDAMEKLLWPEKREGIISRTDRKSILELPLGVTKLRAPVPKGTPVNLLANINIREAITELDIKHLLQDLRPEGGLKGKTVRVLLRANKSPDFLEDRGHTFGSQLSDEDKKALIEFVKTF